jgi:RNA polymerase sigma factor (sigma-70 family)
MPRRIEKFGSERESSSRSQRSAATRQIEIAMSVARRAVVSSAPQPGRSGQDWGLRGWFMFKPVALSPGGRAGLIQVRVSTGPWEARMEWVRHGASKRQFDCFAAETWDPLLRTDYLMTGDAKDAEDLVQVTLLKVARRWNRVRAMDHPAAYARRILTNLVLHDSGRRSRRRAELWPQDGGAETADQSAAQALRQVDDQAEFRWALAQLPARQRAVLVLRY